MRCDERGSVSALVIGLAMSFIACAGLAVDGGRLITAKVRASDQAENAARTGAQALTNLRLGVPVIDQRKALSIAGNHLKMLGASGFVEASRLEVCVSVTEAVEMTLLSLVGVESRRATSRRCARPIME